MLDFVNCAEGPNPSKVHSTILDASGSFAETKSSWSFDLNEQVFENYGQANYIYFMYHGFSLPLGKNTHDCVQQELIITKDEGKSINWENAREITARLGMRDKASLVVCLADPIPESLWLFLSLKMNTFEEQQRSGMLGKETHSAALYLLGILEQRLSSYANHTTSHAASSAFLFTEKHLLQDLYKSLSNKYSSIEEQIKDEL